MALATSLRSAQAGTERASRPPERCRARQSLTLRAALHAVSRDEGRRLSPALEVQLREDRADVVLDRIVRQEDLRGDLLVGLPLGHKEKDLLLLLGQLSQLVGVRTGSDAADPVQDLLRHGRIQQ